MVSSEMRHTLIKHVKKSAFCVCMKNWLLLPIQDSKNFYITDQIILQMPSWEQVPFEKF